MEKIVSIVMIVAIVVFGLISYLPVVINLKSIATYKTTKKWFNMIVLTAVAIVSLQDVSQNSVLFLLCLFLFNLIMQKRSLNQLYANIISFLVDFPIGKFSCGEKNEKGQYWGELEINGVKMEAVAMGDAFEGAEDVAVMVFVQLNNEGNPMLLQVMPILDEELVTEK